MPLTKAKSKAGAKPQRQGYIYKTKPFLIPGLEGTRPLSIYLPPDYYHTDKFYPVAYMFDGQNMYSDEGSFAGGWRMHEVLDERAHQGLMVPIVVGIHHGPKRDEELSPWPPFYSPSAKGNEKLDWVVHWLEPKIEAQFRVLRDPRFRLIGGSSLGGLLALYGLFRHPTVFGKALVMSPALWVHNGAIFPFVMNSDVKEYAKVYIDFGQLEGCECHGGILHDQAKVMADLLEIKDLIPEKNLYWYSDPEGEHNERSWGKRLPQAFRFLFDSQP